MDFTHYQPCYISVLRYNYYVLESIQCIYRFRDDLVESGDFGVFWNLLSAELHRRIRCLGMDGYLPTFRLSPSFYTRYIFELAFQCHWFEVNQHPVAEVMHILLKSCQSASRGKAVEEMNNRRSMTQTWCRSTVMPECWPGIFYDRLKSRSSHKLLEYPWTT